MKPPPTQSRGPGPDASDGSPPEPPMPHDALLVEAAAGDSQKLAALRAQVRAGEPPAYAAGFLRFRGRRFVVDPRTYVTDPELTWLVDFVGREGEALERELGRVPVVAEFGTGAGTLAITLKLEHPNWTVVGLELDPAALEVAVANRKTHGAAVTLVQSDYFSGWPDDLPPPDLVFGDPPWGGDEDLYGAERDAAYYHRMPAQSAFPGGDNPCAIHDELIARVAQRGWPCRLVLNYGVLPPAIVHRSTACLVHRRIVHPAPRLTMISGQVG